MNHIENKCNLISSDKNIESNHISSDNLKSLSLNKQISIKPLGTISTNISVTRTISKSIKPKVLSRKKSKSTKIVLIDLTSDTVYERHIAKRKSRKVAWLEEAKKLGAKTIRASQKMKKQQVAEKMNCSKNSTFKQRSEDLIQLTCAAENAFSKNDLKSSATCDMKTNNDKIKSKEYCETDHTVSAKQSVDTNSSDKNDIVIPCTLSSVIVNKPQSNKCKTSTNSLLNISNNTNNVNKYHDVRDRINNETFNNRHTQTVIKRLIEQDAFPESEIYKKNESLKRICDLETEHCKTVNTSLAICIQDNSKDEAYNATDLSTTKDKLSPSLIHMLWNNEKNGTIDEKADDIGDNERCAQEDTYNKSNKVRYSKSIRVDSELSENKLAISTAAETHIVTAISSTEVSVSNMMESDRLQQLHIIKNIPKEVESQNEHVSVKKGIANNIGNFNVINEDHSNVQTDLHVDTCIKINDDVNDSKFSNRNIRKNIFEDLTRSDKKLTCNILDVSLCSSKERATDKTDIENMKTDCQKSLEIGSNRNYNKEYMIQEQKRYMLSAKIEKDSVERTFDYKLLKSPQKTLHANIQDSLENSCIIHDSELPGNIDGLSLLANVVTSQHGPHSKMEHELKIDQIKVKDYASLRSSPYNQNTDDETDINNSLNAVSRILKNSTTEVVNKIVGIYPDDALGKVAHHIEVTSTTDMNHDGREHKSSNNIPHIVHTSINYETDTVSNNINITESNVQSKENTNVILNGETVVLLQKSPNSNLYIINKAVENARDHNGEDESCPVREKSWMIPPEDCASFEVVNASEHIPFNLEISQYNKDLICQEKKFSISKTKGIKIEPEEETKLMTIAEMKSYSKKGSLSSEVISATSPIYQDTNVANVSINKSTDKRKSKSILTYRQNIKQEFNNHVTPNCGIQGCTGIHSHSHEVIDSQHSLHIPVTHPTPISSIYGNCTAGTDLCMPYHKHCTSVSCSLKINSTASLHSHTKTVNSCGRSHCSCLDCRTYDIVTHCRQYIHPARDTHVSCIESNSYFLPAHSSVQTSAVQEHDRTKSEAVISKLYDDQILCKIEQRVSLQKNNALEKLDMQREPEKLFKKDMDKLPLKKRLKAHAMMSMAYEELPIKTEKLDNYPGIPMMSIAALEPLDDAQKHSSQMIKSSYELSSNKEDRSHGYHFNSNIIRRDYYKDMHISNSHHNLTKESHERPFRPNGDQSNAMCLETCQERTFKMPAQCRDMSVTNTTSLKRMEADTMEQDNTCKKAKKTQSSIRQTRSSKRNVPKVNYCYTDVDPEWNPSGESKRRRKKTSR